MNKDYRKCFHCGATWQKETNPLTDEEIKAIINSRLYWSRGWVTPHDRWTACVDDVVADLQAALKTIDHKGDKNNEI